MADLRSSAPLKPSCGPEGKLACIRVAGHMGEVMQGRLGPGGPGALITLPCPPLVGAARRLGDRLVAAGFAIGHTRPARALLFLPETLAVAAGQLCDARFRGILHDMIGGRDA